jgi:hypothetical protein
MICEWCRRESAETTTYTLVADAITTSRPDVPVEICRECQRSPNLTHFLCGQRVERGLAWEPTERGFCEWCFTIPTDLHPGPTYRPMICSLCGGETWHWITQTETPTRRGVIK